MPTIVYNPDSILCSVKKYLGNYSMDDTIFDDQIIDCINSAISELSILGVGSGETQFTVTSYEDEWADYLGSTNTELIGHARKYIECNVKLAFDPPASPTLVEILQSQMKKAGSYLKISCE